MITETLNVIPLRITGGDGRRLMDLMDDGQVQGKIEDMPEVAKILTECAVEKSAPGPVLITVVNTYDELLLRIGPHDEAIGVIADNPDPAAQAFVSHLQEALAECRPKWQWGPDDFIVA